MIINPLHFSRLMQSNYQDSQFSELNLRDFTPMSNMSKKSDIEIYKDVLKESITEAIGKDTWYPNFEYNLNKVPNKWKDANQSAQLKQISDKLSKHATENTLEHDPTPTSSALKAFCKPSFLSNFETHEAAGFGDKIAKMKFVHVHNTHQIKEEEEDV
jgi:hypothetical protein